jgi:hypothetical protein
MSERLPKSVANRWSRRCADQGTPQRMGGSKDTMIRYRPISMRLNVVGYVKCLSLFGYAQLAAQAPLTSANVSTPVLLSNPTTTRSPVLLKAVNDPHTGKGALLVRWARRRAGDSNQTRGRFAPDIPKRDVNALSGTVH